LGLEKTQVKVYFTIFGDDFPIDVFTQKLGISPTHSYTKGDRIPNRSPLLKRKETAWDLGTEYEESFDVNEQLQRVICQLEGKESVILEMAGTYSLLCKFVIVIVINNGETPSLFFGKSVIRFAANIGAEFDIDLYANPYNDGLTQE
jgi:hypothetical protein